MVTVGFEQTRVLPDPSLLSLVARKAFALLREALCYLWLSFMMDQTRKGTKRCVCCERTLGKAGNSKGLWCLALFARKHFACVVLMEAESHTWALAVTQPGYASVPGHSVEMGISLHMECAAAPSQHAPDSFFVPSCAPGLWEVQAGAGYSLSLQRLISPA